MLLTRYAVLGPLDAGLWLLLDLKHPLTETQFNPIIGLGGMSALETSAALTNHLVALLKSSKNPSTSELESVFAKTQDFRHPRAKALVDVSMLTQHRFAMEMPLLRFLNRYYYPAMGPSASLGLLSDAYTGAVSLELTKEETGLPGEKGKGLPDWLTKSTVRSLPYEDELLHRPAPRSALASVLITSLLVGLVGLGVYSLAYISHVERDVPARRRGGLARERGYTRQRHDGAEADVWGQWVVE